jgi:hypothetical protein
VADAAHPAGPLANVFWLGGGCGAGKTTVARQLSRRLDLRLYPVDAYTYDHARRSERGDFPVTRAWNALSQEERWNASPAGLADGFAAIAAERLELICADLIALGPGPTIVAEGPQLFPDLIAPLLATPGHGLWLLPSPDSGRLGVARRGGSFLAGSAGQRRYERDVLLSQQNRDQAARHGLAVLEVGGGLSLEETITVAARQLHRLPGGVTRADGAQRQQIRQAENAVVVRQLLAWRQDMGPDLMPGPPVFEFACECQAPGCEAVVSLPVTAYQARSSGGPVQGHS